VLEWAIRHRFAALTIAVLLIVWSVADVFILGSEFLPTIDEGNMLVRATMPASISLNRAIDVSTQIERAFKEFPRSKQSLQRSGEPNSAAIRRVSATTNSTSA
jgi:cobalt-zinc-cadmium resistance protein CzcA